MELIDYLRLLRRRIVWVLACTALGLVVANAYLLTATPVYQASAQVFVGSVRAADISPADAQSSSQYVLGRMPSYAALIDSPLVVSSVQQQLGSDLTPDELRDKVGASVLGKTVLLEVTATDSDPEQAFRTANAAAAGLRSTIEQLERPSTGGASTISATVTRPATPPTAPSSPNPPLLLALGALAGLGTGLVAAALRDQALRPPTGWRDRPDTSPPAVERELEAREPDTTRGDASRTDDSSAVTGPERPPLPSGAR